MAVIKTHTGILVRGTERRRVKLHQTANSWVVKAAEVYRKTDGKRSGIQASPTHYLLLDSIRPIATDDGQ